MNRRPVWFGSRSKRAFTLVEIILVTVIIMILVGIVGPKLVGKSKTAKINATKIQMNAIKTALGEFEVHASRFPTTQEGLQGLITRPGDLTQNDWVGPYLSENRVPKDPFGQEFKYTCPSEKGFDFDMISAGPDKKMGTDDDISLFEEQKEKNL